MDWIPTLCFGTEDLSVEFRLSKTMLISGAEEMLIVEWMSGKGTGTSVGAGRAFASHSDVSDIFRERQWERLETYSAWADVHRAAR